MVAGLLLIDLVLLITWQIVDPLTLKIQNLTLEVKIHNRNVASLYENSNNSNNNNNNNNDNIIIMITTTRTIMIIKMII